MKKLSVIVPVYNVEKYLEECIESILAQTMTDYEIILVDDGSCDGSGAICDSYSGKYEHIRTYHKGNGGASSARNFGITKAEGEYLIFIDSDDCYDDVDFFKKIKEILDNDSETVLVHFMRKRCSEITGELDTNLNSINVEKLNSLESSEEIIKELISTDGLAISACFKVIKRSYVMERELFFKEGLVGEDIDWSMRLFSEGFKMVFLKSDAYVYRRSREGSVTNTIGRKNLDDLCDIIELYATDFVNSDNKIKKVLLNYLAYQFSILCGLIISLKDKRDRKEFTKRTESYKWLLNYNLSPKTRRIWKVNKILGFKMTVKVIGMYLKYRSK